MFIKRIFVGLLPVMVFIVLWESIAQLNLVPNYIFPAFSDVMLEFYHLVVSGILLANLLCSLSRVLIGFLLGSAAGIAVGIVMGSKDVIDKSFHPIFSLLYPIPVLGWAPLLMVWIGINDLLPVALIFLCSFFPVLYNTITGIKSVDREVIKAAKILGASDRKNFKLGCPASCSTKYLYRIEVRGRYGMAGGDSSGNGCDSYGYRGFDDSVREFTAYGCDNRLPDGSFSDVPIIRAGFSSHGE